MKYKLPFIPTQFYFHWYKDWRSYAFVVSVTTQNATIQIGPLFLSIAYFGYDW